MNWLAYWELKLVALVIAVGLWQYTNGQVRIDKTIRVTVSESAVQRLPAGKYQVTSIEPREFTVHVSTPANLADSFRIDGLVPKLEIGTEELALGRQDFPVGNRLLGLNDDIRISFESDTPRAITVTFERIEDDYLPVEPPRLEHVPTGLEPTLVLDRTRVRVAAARSRLEELRRVGHRVQFLPVSLEDVDPLQAGTREEKLHLKDQDAQVRVSEDVIATITLRPKIGAPRTVSLPVSILASRDLFDRGRLELTQSQVVLNLRGPVNLLEALKPETDLTAFVQVRRAPDPDAPMELPIQVLGPSWLTWDRATVRVTLVPTLPVTAPVTSPVTTPAQPGK